MEYISGETLIANFFVYRTFQNKFEVTVHGINGQFHTPEAIAEFITNTKDHDLSSIEKEITERYPALECDQFYWVHATLIYVSGEYGDYGVCIGKEYYTIGEVLDVAIEEVEFEDIVTTESA
jgi:hypothetical protein